MIVVDTNILAWRWLNNPRSPEVERLMARDADWAAPLLWRSEFRNILAGFMRARRLTLDQAQAVMEEAARSLPAGEHGLADQAVLALVARSNCTAYDCEFVALAESLGTMLVTEDQQVLRAFPQRCRSLTRMIDQSG